MELYLFPRKLPTTIKTYIYVLYYSGPKRKYLCKNDEEGSDNDVLSVEQSKVGLEVGWSKQVTHGSS
jgi:hypothetical protein